MSNFNAILLKAFFSFLFQLLLAELSQLFFFLFLLKLFESTFNIVCKLMIYQKESLEIIILFC